MYVYVMSFLKHTVKVKTHFLLESVGKTKGPHNFKRVSVYK